MTTFVVDSNVAIVANRRGTHADERCQLACVEKLESVVEREVIAIDEARGILSEYQKYLQTNGMLGAGDIFYKHVLNHLYQTDRVQVVPITPSEDPARGFEELPENAFDRSDRKFLAVAVAVGGVVLNATDSDWAEHESLMDELGVEVCQLCPQHASKDPGKE